MLICPSGYKPDHSTHQCVTSLVDIPQAAETTVQAASPVTSTSFAVANAVSGSFSLNMMMCLVATESLVNMQFLNINHSNIASTIYSAMSSSYIPNWIASFNHLDRELLIFPWGSFRRSQISSLFLDNFGDTLTELVGQLVLYILMACVTCSMKIEKLNRSFTGKLYVIAFGLFASGIFGKLQSQLLYSILQMLKFNLLLDSYSIMSLLTGYLTLSFSIGLHVFCFFRMQSIFNNQASLEMRKSSTSDLRVSSIGTEPDWSEKKYEFLFVDFKSSQKNHFFFAYWIAAFNAIYILLIISLQSVPVLQCFSLVILALVFILFPAITKPFKTRQAAFLHFFNFSCVLIALTLNLTLAIIQNFTPDFSGIEVQGKVVISIIAINTGTNALVSLGEMLLEIFQKCKNSRKHEKKNKALRMEQPRPVDTRISHQRPHEPENGYLSASRPNIERDQREILTKSVMDAQSSSILEMSHSSQTKSHVKIKALTPRSISIRS